jgi:hypothetical protein
MAKLISGDLQGHAAMHEFVDISIDLGLGNGPRPPNRATLPWTRSCEGSPPFPICWFCWEHECVCVISELVNGEVLQKAHEWAPGVSVRIVCARGRMHVGHWGIEMGSAVGAWGAHSHIRTQCDSASNGQRKGARIAVNVC